MPKSILLTFLLGGLSICLLGSAHASDRRFTYSYETVTATAGSIEYEQWFTWQQGEGFDKYQFRHELEFGLTDRLQLGVYLFDWEHAKDDGDSKTQWQGTGVELIYQLTDPTTSAFGSAVYLEAVAGSEEAEVEAKFLLQKNFGPFVAVYNLIIEGEWEDRYKEKIGAWQNTFGLSYEVSPRFFVGLEATHEMEFEDWSGPAKNIVNLGPNVSFRKGNFFATLTGLFQATNVEGEADTQVRVIAGISF